MDPQQLALLAALSGGGQTGAAPMPAYPDAANQQASLGLQQPGMPAQPMPMMSGTAGAQPGMPSAAQDPRAAMYQSLFTQPPGGTPYAVPRY